MPRIRVHVSFQKVRRRYCSRRYDWLSRFRRYRSRLWSNLGSLILRTERSEIIAGLRDQQERSPGKIKKKKKLQANFTKTAPIIAPYISYRREFFRELEVNPSLVEIQLFAIFFNNLLVFNSKEILK